MHEDELSSILDGAIPTYTTDEQEAKGPKRFIDIHIYDLAEEEQIGPVVESIAPEPEASEAELPRIHRSLVPWLFVGLCLLALGTLLAVWYLVPFLTLQATITIVPVSRQLPPLHTTLHIVNGPLQGSQIEGRALPAISMSQQQTAKATGIAHQDATAAHGWITFYNALPAPQTIPAGELLTASNGVEVITDQDASLPAAQLPTDGQASVSAHTLVVGPGGNIGAGAIYGPCCRAEVLAANSAFSGGQNARSYQTVKQADIDTAAGNLKTSLNASVQAALAAQVRTSETLITPLSCKQQTSSNHQAGDEAHNITVTVQATCTGEVYSTAAYQQSIEQIVTQAARLTYGTSYSRAGAVQSSVQATHQTNHGVDLTIICSATYVYQFSQSDIQQMKTLIAGKNKAEATRLLLSSRGVQSVSISLSSGGMLPTDTGRMTLSWLAYAAS